jgi:hypothetical protein
MWGACVSVYQLLNWKMHSETLKLKKNGHDMFSATVWDPIFFTFAV